MSIQDSDELERLWSWFEENAIDFSKSTTLGAPGQTLPHAWFNSETAQIKIEIRTSDLQYTMQTGDGDGDYLVWALLQTPVAENEMYVADGVFPMSQLDYLSPVINMPTAPPAMPHHIKLSIPNNHV